jgi:hypothetical protein
MIRCKCCESLSSISISVAYDAGGGWSLLRIGDASLYSPSAGFVHDGIRYCTLRVSCTLAPYSYVNPTESAVINLQHGHYPTSRPTLPMWLVVHITVY